MLATWGINNIFCELAYLPGLMMNNNPRVVFVARLAVESHLDPGIRFENLSSCLCSSGCSGTFSVVVVVCAVREHTVFCLRSIVHGVVCCELRICLCRCFVSSDIHVNDSIQGFPSRMLNRRDAADIVNLKNAGGKFVPVARVSWMKWTDATKHKHTEF